MRRICWLLVLGAALVLAGCGGAKTPAEQYLTEHSPEELLRYFEAACYFGKDYDGPEERSENDMYRFGLAYGVEDKAVYDEATKLYHLKLTDLTAVFDRYFVEWQFDTAYFGDEYDPETGEIVTTAFGFGGGGWEYDQVLGAEVLSDDEIEVHLEGSFEANVPPAEDDPEGLWGSETLYCDSFVRAKIVDGEARFISYHNQER